MHLIPEKARSFPVPRSRTAIPAERKITHTTIVVKYNLDCYAVGRSRGERCSLQHLDRDICRKKGAARSGQFFWCRIAPSGPGSRMTGTRNSKQPTTER